MYWDIDLQFSSSTVECRFFVRRMKRFCGRIFVFRWTAARIGSMLMNIFCRWGPMIRQNPTKLLAFILLLLSALNTSSCFIRPTVLTSVFVYPCWSSIISYLCCCNGYYDLSRNVDAAPRRTRVHPCPGGSPERGRSPGARPPIPGSGRCPEPARSHRGRSTRRTTLSATCL